MAAHSAGRETVRRAVIELTAEGLVEPVRRRGTVVRARPARRPITRSRSYTAMNSATTSTRQPRAGVRSSHRLSPGVLCLSTWPLSLAWLQGTRPNPGPDHGRPGDWRPAPARYLLHTRCSCR